MIKVINKDTPLETWEIIDKFSPYIRSGIVIHNDELNIDFKILEVKVSERLQKSCRKVEIVIYVLDDIDKDIQKTLDTLRNALGELLPQKEVRNE